MFVQKKKIRNTKEPQTKDQCQRVNLSFLIYAHNGPDWPTTIKRKH